MKKCVNCGKEIAEDSKFCEFCGAKQETANPEMKEVTNSQVSSESAVSEAKDDSQASPESGGEVVSDSQASSETVEPINSTAAPVQASTIESKPEATQAESVSQEAEAATAQTVSAQNAVPTSTEKQSSSLWRKKWLFPTIGGIVVVIIAAIVIFVQVGAHNMDGTYYAISTSQSEPEVGTSEAFKISENEVSSSDGNVIATLNKGKSDWDASTGGTVAKYTYKDGVLTLYDTQYAKKSSSAYKKAESAVKNKQKNLASQLKAAKALKKRIDAQISSSQNAIASDFLKQIGGTWTYSNVTSDNKDDDTETKDTDNLTFIVSNTSLNYTESTVNNFTDSSDNSNNSTDTNSENINGNLTLITSDDSSDYSSDYEPIDSVLSDYSHRDSLSDIISSLENGDLVFGSKTQAKYESYLSDLKKMTDFKTYSQLTKTNYVAFDFSGTGKDSEVTTGDNSDNSSSDASVDTQEMDLTYQNSKLTVNYEFNKIGSDSDSNGITLTKN